MIVLAQDLHTQPPDMEWAVCTVHTACGIPVACSARHRRFVDDGLHRFDVSCGPVASGDPHAPHSLVSPLTALWFVDQCLQSGGGTPSEKLSTFDSPTSLQIRRTRRRRACTPGGSHLTSTLARRVLRTQSFRDITSCLWHMDDEWPFLIYFNLFVFRYARTWLWHIVVGLLFLDRSWNTISWLVLPLLRLEWDVIGTYSWGPLQWLGAPRTVGTPISEVARTSYRFGCGSVSRSLGRTIMSLRYVLNYLFSLHIFYVKCVFLTIWNLIFRGDHLRTPNPSPYWVTVGRRSRTSPVP
jgi:hypothetical protein